MAIDNPLTRLRWSRGEQFECAAAVGLWAAATAIGIARSTPPSASWSTMRPAPGRSSALCAALGRPCDQRARKGSYGLSPDPHNQKERPCVFVPRSCHYPSCLFSPSPTRSSLVRKTPALSFIEIHPPELLALSF